MRVKTNSKLRWFFLLLSLLAIVSAATWTMNALRVQADNASKNELSGQLVEQLETGVRDVIIDAGTHLALLSYQLSPSLEGCAAFLEQVKREVLLKGVYVGLAVLGQQGDIRCSSAGYAESARGVRDFAFESAAFSQYNFLIGDFALANTPAGSVLPIVIKSRTDLGQGHYLAAQVNAGLFQAQLDTLNLPSFAAAYVVSSRGEIVAARHATSSRHWLGETVGETELFQRLRNEPTDNFISPGFDGSPKAVSARSIETVNQPFYLIVTSDTSSFAYQLSAITRDGSRFIVLTVMASCLTFLLVAYVLFARPLHRFSRSLRELAAEFANPKFDKQPARPMATLRHVLQQQRVQITELSRIANVVSWQAFKTKQHLTFTIDTQHAPVFFNSLTDLYDKQWLALIYKNDRESYLSALERLFEHNETVKIVFRITDEQGDLCYIELSGQPHNEAGSDKYFGSLHDVSKRKVLENRLEQSQQYMRVVMDILGESVIACDAAGQVLEFNAMSEKIHGKKRAPVGPEQLAHYYSLYTEDGRRLLKPKEIPLLRALGGESFQDERIMIAPDDLPKRIVSLRGQPIYNSQKEKIGAVVVQEDISNLLYVKSQVREKEEEFEAIFEANLDTLVVIDDEHTITLINQAGVDLHGYRRRELVGKSITKLFATPLDVDLSLPKKGILRKEFDIETRDGHAVPVEFLMSEITLRGAKAYLCIIRDQRERKKTERRLNQLQRMEAVGRLTGGIAHDFNNLLQVILMNLELLDDEVVIDDNAKQMVQSAYSAATRGGELTSHLLTFTRQQAYHAEEADINQLLSKSQVLFESVVSRKLVLEFEFDSRVPVCRVDISQFEMCISQLLMNADDAMSGIGSVTVVTEVTEFDAPRTLNDRIFEPGRYCRIAVTDTGVGMSDNELNHAFEPFFTTKKLGQNSGLGLSIVYGFIEESNGGIQLLSRKGKGTTAEIYLPLVSSGK